MLDKHRARTIKQEISRVLWDVWDPIGVKGFDGPRDEYASYVNGVYELLLSGASDEDVAKHLLHIATETMGLSGPTVDVMRPTVTALRAVKLSNTSVEPQPNRNWR